MTCYFRHLKNVFEKADIEVTGDNKKMIDKIIHGLVNVEYKNCSLAWKAVKNRIANDEARFVAELGEAWASQEVS